MKQFCLFILVSIFCIDVSAQIDYSLLYDKWVKVDVRKRDGSKLLPRPFADSTYFDLSITPTEMVYNGDPVSPQHYNVIYQKFGNLLRTSPTSGHRVERLEKDTLVLLEETDGFGHDKLRQTKFVRAGTLYEFYKNKFAGQKSIIANKYYTPTLNQQLIELTRAGNAQEFKADFDIAGQLVLYHNKPTTINFIASTATEEDRQKVAYTFGITRNHWDLTRFREYDTIKIPFVYRVGKNLKGRVAVKFHEHSWDAVDAFKTPWYKEVAAAKKLVKKAERAFDKRRYLQAAELFANAYAINPSELNCLYNQAVALNAAGNKEEACAIWKQLSDLEQVRGKKLYKANCER